MSYPADPESFSPFKWIIGIIGGVFTTGLIAQSRKVDKHDREIGQLVESHKGLQTLVEQIDKNVQVLLEREINRAK